MKEPFNWSIQSAGDREQRSSRDAIMTAFIFVDLLAGAADLRRQLGLGHRRLQAGFTDPVSDLMIAWRDQYSAQ